MRNNINKIFLLFFYTLTLIINSTCQKRINFLKNRVYEFNEIPKVQGEVPLNVNEPSNSSNFIKCSDFIKNCDSCNSHQCTKCINNYIFINDNFKECVLKDSIDLEFYYTNDNISYFSCRDNKYQNHKKCQELSKATIEEKKNNNPEIIEIEQGIKSTFHSSYLKLPSSSSFTRRLDENHNTQSNQISITPSTYISTTQATQISTTQANQISTTQAIQISTTQATQISTTQANQVSTTQTTQLPSTQTTQLPSTQTIQVSTTQATQVPTTQATQVPSTLITQVASTQANLLPSTQVNQVSTTQATQLPTTQIPSTLKTQIPTTQTTQTLTTLTTQLPTTLTTQVSTIQATQLISTLTNQIPTTQTTQISTTQATQIPSTQTTQISTTQATQIPSTQTTQISTTQTTQISTTQTTQISTTQTNQIPSTQTNQIPSTQTNQIPSTQTNQIPSTQTTQVPTNQMPSNPIDKISTTIVKLEDNIKTTGKVIYYTTSTIQKPTPSTQIKLTTDKPEPTSTTIKNHSQEKIFFFLQVQKIDGYLYIYLIINFSINESELFTFEATTDESRNLRNLEKIKDIRFHPIENYEGKGDKIVSLVSYEVFSENKIVIKRLKGDENGKKIVIKSANNNPDYFDTKKVEEMINRNEIVNFEEIVKNRANYNISRYRIISSLGNCELCLNSDIEINQANKNIELSFIGVKENNNITSKCILSSRNNKTIICNLTKDINSTYILDPYSTFDKTEAITILQDNINNYLQLQCQLSKIEASTDRTDDSKNGTETLPVKIEKKKKKGGLSGGAVAGIIVGIIFIIIASVVAVIIYKKIKQKHNIKKDDNQIIISKFYEYPSNASNINF